MARKTLRQRHLQHVVRKWLLALCGWGALLAGGIVEAEPNRERAAGRHRDAALVADDIACLPESSWAEAVVGHAIVLSQQLALTVEDVHKGDEVGAQVGARVGVWARCGLPPQGEGESVAIALGLHGRQPNDRTELHRLGQRRLSWQCDRLRGPHHNLLRNRYIDGIALAGYRQRGVLREIDHLHHDKGAGGAVEGERAARIERDLVGDDAMGGPAGGRCGAIAGIAAHGG